MRNDLPVTGLVGDRQDMINIRNVCTTINLYTDTQVLCI